MSQVYTLGETVLDIIFKDKQPPKASPGGSALNSAVSLARSGIQSVFIGAAGNDASGKLIMEFLKDNFIETSHFILDDKSQTIISLAFLKENADAEYQFYKNNAPGISIFSLPDIKKEDILLISSYFAIDNKNYNKLLPYLQQVKENKSLIYYDLNFRKNHLKDLNTSFQNIISNMNLAIVIKCSEEDLENIFQETELEKLYNTYCPFNDKIFIKTAGNKKVEMIVFGIKYESEVPQINPVSTIGAGDSFNAGFIHGLIKNNIQTLHLNKVKSSVWNSILKMAIHFSGNTCLSFDNYIDSNFTNRE